MRIISRLSLFHVLFILLPVFLQGQSPDENNLEIVISSLRENSIPFELRSLLSDYGGFGSSIIVRSPGFGEISKSSGSAINSTETASSAETAGSAGTVVFAVPLYAEFAVNTALVLAKKAYETGAGFSNNDILVAFLGDEYSKLPINSGGITHKGLRDLLTLNDIPENWVLCYLDAESVPDKLLLRHGNQGYVAPLEIIKPLPLLFRNLGIPWSFRIRFNELYKLGLVEGPVPLLITWDEEINAFVLSENNRAKRNSPGILPEDLAEVLLDYSAAVNFPILITDRHYSIFSFPGGRIFFLGEGHTVILLLITIGICLILFLIYSARFNAIFLFHIRLFFKSVWVFIILLPLLVVSIKASGLFYSMLFFKFGPSLPDTSAINYAGAGLTILLAILIFNLPSPVLNLIHFPKRAQFYGVSAVIYVIIGMSISAFLDFSYVPVFLWSFFFIFLGVSLSSPVQVFICVFLAPLFAMGALLNIFQTGAGRIVALFISPFWNNPDSWSASLQTALLSLPLFLLYKRGTILIKRNKNLGLEQRPRRINRLVIVSILSVIVIGIMLIEVHFYPENSILHENRIIYEESGTRDPIEVIDLSLNDILFQDSRIITLNIFARGDPIRFDIFLESKNQTGLLPVYSATVPFLREEDGRKIFFSLGEYPPNPLGMEFVVPINFEGSLTINAIYDLYDKTIDPDKPPASDNYVLTVVKEAGI